MDLSCGVVVFPAWYEFDVHCHMTTSLFGSASNRQSKLNSANLKLIFDPTKLHRCFWRQWCMPYPSQIPVMSPIMLSYPPPVSNHLLRNQHFNSVCLLHHWHVQFHTLHLFVVQVIPPLVEPSHPWITYV